MEVSFDLEDGVHPEDSLFDGIDLTFVCARLRCRLGRGLSGVIT